MSANSTTVTPEHFRYIAERTTPEDAFLTKLKAAARQEGIPPIWISPEQASLMQILLRLRGAEEVLEIGTLAGYSAICMARALPDGGRVRTLELDAAHAAFAEQWIAHSDVAGKVEVIVGAAGETLPLLEMGSADAAFVDADKENQPRYLEECLRILRPGGLLMVDNAFAFGQVLDAEPTDRDVPAVRRFNDLLARDGRLQSIIVPVGDGCWVGVKKDARG